MMLFINVITAWISVFLAVLLSVVYLLRIINKGKKKNLSIARLNKKLRNVHKPMGIAFVVFASIHGFFSSGSILSFNFGSACLAVGILLGLSYWLRKAYRRKLSWFKPHRFLTVVLIVFLGCHLWEIGGAMGPETFLTGVQNEMETSVEALYGNTTEVAKANTGTDNATVTDVVIPQSNSGTTGVTESANLFLGNVDLEDGIYTGVADGYGPDLTVSVTVAGNIITDIQVVSHNEKNVKYFDKAIDAVPQAIIAAQNPVVDTISGATYTSNGIMQAVLNALDTAVISGTLPSL
ncbi:FMN-binding protein [Acetobacterium sp.]|uniref:FMN-binding protein n=1 Tax=Acetobacterium sp. TaxID=1872094 RepID=UPI002F40A45E